MADSNPKCDPKKGGCKHAWSFHKKALSQPCGAMGCHCAGFVGSPPVESKESAAFSR